MKSNESNKKRNILIPVIVFFVINTIVQYLQQVQSFDFVSLFGFLIQVITYNVFAQAFAYLTCYFFVIKRNKGQKGVWINYIIWILLMNLGNVVAIIQK